MPTKTRTQKKTESDAFVEDVRAVLTEAHAAANTAIEAFLAKATIDKDGHVRDTCGFAWVVVYGVSPRLRSALKKLGEIERSGDGGWYISNFTRDLSTQSISAREAACRAACDVLRKRFPTDGEFFAPSRMD